MAGLNKELLSYALRRTAGEKVAFVPSDAAAGGGAPPGGGGAPPGGAPPGGAPPAPPAGDPAAGGAPAMGADPASAGGGAPPTDPNMIDQKVQNAVQQALQASGGGGAAGGAPGAGGMKPPKPDIGTIAQDVFQLKKLLFHQMRQEGRELPPDILDGPNRDPQSGMPSANPGNGSDPAGGGQTAPPPNAISGIQPIQPAMLGAGKSASAPITGPELLKEAASLLRLYAAWKSPDPIDAWDKQSSVEHGNSVVVGQPFGQSKVSQSPLNKAAAVCSMFRARQL